jgi:hypothetical protein
MTLCGSYYDPSRGPLAAASACDARSRRHRTKQQQYWGCQRHFHCHSESVDYRRVLHKLSRAVLLSSHSMCGTAICRTAPARYHVLRYDGGRSVC